MRTFAKLSLLFWLVVVLPYDANASAYREVASPGVEGSNFPCKRLLSLLNDKREQPAPKEPVCARRLRLVPGDFQEFSFPDWQPIPSQEVTLPLVRNLWNTWIQHWAQLQGLPPAQIWEGQGLEQDIQRRLHEQKYVIQTARFDIDQDGNEDSVMRLDTSHCEDEPGGSVIQPYLGLYAYPKITGVTSVVPFTADDRRRVGSASYNGDVFFYGRRPYVIEFNHVPPARSLRSLTGQAIGTVWVHRLKVLPAALNGSILTTSAPVCAFSIIR